MIPGQALKTRSTLAEANRQATHVHRGLHRCPGINLKRKLATTRCWTSSTNVDVRARKGVIRRQCDLGS